MSLKHRLIHRLEFKLVLFFSTGFVVLALLLFAFISFQLSTSIRLKERQFVLEKASQYLSIANARGMDSLLAHLDRKASPTFKPGMLVLINAPDGTIAYALLPEFWETYPLADIPKEMDARTGEWGLVGGSGWFGDASEIDESDWLEITSKKLAQGYTLYIGYSNEEIEETQSRLRDLFFNLLGFSLVVGILGGIFLSWQTLLPLKELLSAIKRVESGEMGARVRTRGTGDDLDELAHKFNQMLSKIETLIRAMAESLDNVAHDLRTPLARMRASIEKSVEDGEDDALMDSLLDCAEETERLNSIINTLMDISEAETGTMNLHPETISILDLMNSVCDVYQIPAEEKQITLTKIVPKGLSVLADPGRLYQVIANLVDNGVKYTPPHGRVTLTASQEGPGIKICVEDTGPGIPEKDIPKIFDRLFRCDRSRSQKGLGLGLSMVQAVVRAHNGTIVAENLKDRGTRFTLLLP